MIIDYWECYHHNQQDEDEDEIYDDVKSTLLMVKMKIMKISKTLQLVEVGVSLQSCLGTSPHTSLGEQHVVKQIETKL